jgi:16S rRNA (adenine1518-N6/adenine1519-N6)-dimethyltransferase
MPSSPNASARPDADAPADADARDDDVGDASGDGGVPHDPGGLTSATRVRALLTRHGLAADKGFGQHFLIDRSALAAIVAAADLAPEDEVWEVGPGLGTLTRELARRARRVVAVELDARLLPVLAETLAPWPHVEVVHADALRIDLTAAAAGAAFVANLPYHVGTAVLTRVLAAGRFRRAVVLVQREVGARLVARAGDAAFGSLSLWVAHHGRARLVRLLPPGAFLPPPKVTSAVVRIDLDTAARPDPVTFALIRDGFRHRRKTLLANLRAAGDDPERVRAVLETIGIDPRARAETLDLAAFRRLATLLRAARDETPRG